MGGPAGVALGVPSSGVAVGVLTTALAVEVGGHVPEHGVWVGLGPTVLTAVDVGAGTHGVASGGAIAKLSTRAVPIHV